MIVSSLLDRRYNISSQNGEDGIIEAILERLSITRGACCEFGAWDGIHFSNCRRLVLNGWRAVMIEGDAERFHALTENYRGIPAVTCVNRYVDDDEWTLDRILADAGIGELDFLSIDIDGLDYYILRSLRARPKFICVEVNAAHTPLAPEVDRAMAAMTGQPLGVFAQAAAEKGYALICYSGNVFFLRRDLLDTTAISELSPAEAYRDFIAHLTVAEREHLYLANLGLADPPRHFRNPELTARCLSIPCRRAAILRYGACRRRLRQRIHGSRAAALFRRLKRLFSQ